jgi:hypothetical protein
VPPGPRTFESSPSGAAHARARCRRSRRQQRLQEAGAWWRPGRQSSCLGSRRWSGPGSQPGQERDLLRGQQLTLAHHVFGAGAGGIRRKRRRPLSDAGRKRQEQLGRAARSSTLGDRARAHLYGRFPRVGDRSDDHTPEGGHVGSTVHRVLDGAPARDHGAAALSGAVRDGRRQRSDRRIFFSSGGSARQERSGHHLPRRFVSRRPGVPGASAGAASTRAQDRGQSARLPAEAAQGGRARQRRKGAPEVGVTECRGRGRGRRSEQRLWAR